MAGAMNKLRSDMADRFIDALSQGQLPWRACWRQQRPVNMTTGKLYRGINAMFLSYIADEMGYTDHRWCTYKQAQEQGWQVRKGEKSTRVEYWAYYDHKQKKLLSWEEVRRLLAADPNYTENLQLSSRVYSVFNACQMDGVPELLRSSTDIGAVRAQRDTLLLNMAVGYREAGNEAYYNAASDEITLPRESAFDDTYSYMVTLLHECGHASGHPSRLDRDLSGKYGTPDYAREELRAEIASAFTVQALGLELSDTQMEQHMKQHIAYVQSWAGVLKKNPEELFRAIKAAEEISDYLIEKGDFAMKQPQQKPAQKEWYLVYKSADPLEGELEVVPSDALQGREVIEVFRCFSKQEALEKLERYEELQQLFWRESDDPETQMWRDDLTSDEAAMVEKWDIQASKGFSRLVQAASETAAAAQTIAKPVTTESTNNHSKIIPWGITPQSRGVHSFTSPAELLAAASRYPLLTREQISEVVCGIRDKLTEEQLAVFAKPEFTPLQMNALRYALKDGLPPSAIDLIANPDFDPVKMDIIRSGFVAGMTHDQVLTFAKPELTAHQMMDIYLQIPTPQRSAASTPTVLVFDNGAEPDFEP